MHTRSWDENKGWVRGRRESSPVPQTRAIPVEPLGWGPILKQMRKHYRFIAFGHVLPLPGMPESHRSSLFQHLDSTIQMRSIFTKTLRIIWSRYTTTFLCCPIRKARLIACWPTTGFQETSNKTTREAPTRKIPSLHAFTDAHNTRDSELELKRVMVLSLSAGCIFPSNRRICTPLLQPIWRLVIFSTKAIEYRYSLKISSFSPVAWHNRTKSRTHLSFAPSLTRPQFLEGLKCEPKWKTAEEGGVGARSLTHNTWGVEGRVGGPGWD